MAGIIDVRFNYKTKRWTAKPRFAYDKESFLKGPASADGINPSIALCALADLLPEEMANKIRTNVPRRIYRSPEYIWMDDKCFELDGHCPSKKEWAERRRNFLLDQKSGRITI